MDTHTVTIEDKGEVPHDARQHRYKVTLDGWSAGGFIYHDPTHSERELLMNVFTGIAEDLSYGLLMGRT